MKAIVTIKQGNKDNKNFTRELDMSPEECEYLQEATRIINGMGGEEFIGVYVHQI